MFARSFCYEKSSMLQAAATGILRVHIKRKKKKFRSEQFRNIFDLEVKAYHPVHEF